MESVSVVAWGWAVGEGFTTKGLRKLLGAMEMVYILIMVLFTGVCSFLRTIYLKWLYGKKKKKNQQIWEISKWVGEQKGALSHPMLTAEPSRKKTPLLARTQPMRSQGLFVSPALPVEAYFFPCCGRDLLVARLGCKSGITILFWSGRNPSLLDK